MSWKGDPIRHGLASKGIKTNIRNKYKRPKTYQTDTGKTAYNYISNKRETKDWKKELRKKEDETMGGLISDELREKIKDRLKGKDIDTKEVKRVIDKGTPAELLNFIRKGKIIESDSIELSDKNLRLLNNHLADLSHDVKKFDEMVDIFEDKKDEMIRYLTEKYKNKKKKISKKYKSTDDKAERNELEHEKKNIKSKYKEELSEFRAEFERLKQIRDGLKQIYKERKEFVDRWFNKAKQGGMSFGKIKR